MRTRAERRHNNQRVKNNFYKSVKMWPWGPDNIEEYARNRSLFYNTRKPCSCWMCCNPRKKNSWSSGKEKVTIQERKELMRGRLIDRIVGS